MPLNRPVSPALVLPLVSVLLLAGCSAEKYRKDADHEVYGLIQDKQREAGFEPYDGFSIDAPADPLRDRLLALVDDLSRGIDADDPAIPEEEPNGPFLDEEEDLSFVPDKDSQDLSTDETFGVSSSPYDVVLNLEDCLAVAAENSRAFQREKENVYLAALALTLQRHQFRNQYFATASGTGGQDLPEERSVTGQFNTGFTRTLASGGQVLFDIGATLFHAFVGDRDDSASSLIDLAITQPLLRGAGRSIAQEPLTQAERDALYAIRSYERFKRELAVTVVSDMYRVLQSLDSVKNALANYQSLEDSRIRTGALAEAGRTARFEVGQARQQELTSRDRWISQIQSYETALDRFKITLGLPTDAPIVIAPEELERLTEAGLAPVDIDGEGAKYFALENRLDLANAWDAVADAERRVKVSEDALRAGLSVSFATRVGNEDNKPGKFEFGDGTYLLGADLDLPLDRKAERNAYRSSLISYERERRTYEQLEDSVKLEIRSGVRNLIQAEESYRIQVAALDLAERRVESAELLQQAGRASTRDYLEAQQDLVEAQDALTGALIGHEIARLELLRDMGLLTVDQQGLSYDTSTDRYTEAGY